MRRILRMLALAIMCGSVAAMGGCTSDEGGAATSDSSSSRAVRSESASESVDGAEQSMQNGLLTPEEAAAALGEFVLGGFDTLPPLTSDCHPLLGSLLPPDVSWDASTSFLLKWTDLAVARTTDVSECAITSVDPKTTAEVYAYLEDLTPTYTAPLGEGRYAPAPIGVEAFAWELDGGGGAIDRFVVVNTGDSLVGIVANRTGPVAEGDNLRDNLTREQVDNLVKAAVGKLAVELAKAK